MLYYLYNAYFLFFINKIQTTVLNLPIQRKKQLVQNIRFSLFTWPVNSVCFGPWNNFFMKLYMFDRFNLYFLYRALC